MKKLLTTMFCLSIIALGAQGAFAQNFDNGNPPPVKHHKGMKKMPPRVNLEEYLNLTEQQKAQVKANRIKSRKAMKPIMNSISDKREAILDVMDSDLPKAQQEAKIKALKEEINGLHKQANEIRKQNMKDFEAILTPEQKAKFEKFKQEHKPPKGHCPNGKCKKDFKKGAQK